jgi:CRISPR-associated endonuclease/helicase Cas3
VGFDAFFKSGAGNHQAYPYQVRSAEHAWPETLVVPTGFGKTAAVLAAWLWKIGRGDAETPRRLVYCLPMRTLVEQTESAAKRWIDTARSVLGLEVNLDVLMGGRSEGRRGLPKWMLYPERPAILIGTQDILISAALMRGYGASRYRWPVDFALLHNDALWVFDEVQLTGATLATSAQLEAFRRRFCLGRDSRTLWMSATLDPAWLKTVDFAPVGGHRPHDLSSNDLAQAEHLWTARKTLRTLDLSDHDFGKKGGLKFYAAALAKKACDLTKTGTNTIVFLNTVARAQAVYEALNHADGAPERLLIHSRFRAADRAALMERLRADAPPEGRIVVTTQALEAGVDVTSATMITEIAPWSSLVQRFGRCNRNGEHNVTGADVFWIDLRDEEAKPYEPGDFAEARKKLANLSACGPVDLAVIPPSAPPRGAVIRKRDLFDLFDTEPDLSGFDVDVSLYVREADDTDVRLFWRPVKGDAPPEDAATPTRDELCPAPIGGAKQLVERKDVRAWAWNALIGEWRSIKKGDVFPGLMIWVDAASGGYDTKKGFDPASKAPVELTLMPDAHEVAPGEAANDDPDTYKSKVRVSLMKHGMHARDQAVALANAFNLSTDEREIIVESALWHDLGKAHETFRARCGLASEDVPLAKTPDYNWRSDDERNRRYFRHELASALAYLANRQWDEKANLAAYLIAAHHGKVRMRLCALPKEVQPENGRLFARGVWDGDELPQTHLGDVVVRKTKLDLDLMQLGEGPCGSSWSARMQGLLKEFGPFRLAWLEALVRIADWRASEAEEKASHDDV